jgi:hypothetical protein
LDIADLDRELRLFKILHFYLFQDTEEFLDLWSEMLLIFVLFDASLCSLYLAVFFFFEEIV